MSPLSGRTIALSISDAPDRLKLGFPPQEIDRALFSLCLALIRNGAFVQYAGNLSQEGFTFKLFRHLAGAYLPRVSDPPFIHLIPEPVLRRATFAVLLEFLKECRAVTSTAVFIAHDMFAVRSSGDEIFFDKGDHRSKISSDTELLDFLAEPKMSLPEAYAFARQEASKSADARIALGGKMGILNDPADQYEGAMPGVVQEAIQTLTLGRPFIPLAAFGGATRDIAIKLQLLDASNRVPRGPQHESYRAALKRLGELPTNIPPAIKERLVKLADCDQVEEISSTIIQLLAQWIGRAAPRVR
jgi:hypothetical protein